MIVKLLQKIDRILEEKKIDYMVSGSVALGFYSATRTTRDIDIVIELNRDDVEKFVSGFEDFFIDEIGIKEEVRRRGIFNLIDKKTAFRIDFIVRANSEYAKVEFARRKRLPIEGIYVWVVSLEDLIIAKLRWIQDFQSDRQLNDIKMLLRNPEIDRKYLDDWIAKLKLKTFTLNLND